jgi:hypothetical protein
MQISTEIYRAYLFWLAQIQFYINIEIIFSDLFETPCDSKLLSSG